MVLQQMFSVDKIERIFLNFMYWTLFQVPYHFKNWKSPLPHSMMVCKEDLMKKIRRMREWYALISVSIRWSRRNGAVWNRELHAHSGVVNTKRVLLKISMRTCENATTSAKWKISAKKSLPNTLRFRSVVVTVTNRNNCNIIMMCKHNV